jgi:hypothetical protein
MTDKSTVSSSTTSLIGKQFGNWIVIDDTNAYIYPNSTKQTRYTKGILVQCPHGTTMRRALSALRRGDTKGCVICSHEEKFKGIGDLSSSYIGSIKLGADLRDLEYSVSTECLWALFEEQNRKCKLSGLDISLDPHYSTNCRKGQKFVTQTASLDRIDNTRGYTEGNVQWIHKDINIMKLDHNQEYFVELCELIARTRKVEPRLRVIARVSIEGIHRWAKCPIPEVSYLRDYHRHIFNIIGKAYVNHSDRDIEFIQLSHQIKNYLADKYFDKKYNCCFFDDASCEMLADELATKFNLYECEVNEDGEGGSLVRNLG